VLRISGRQSAPLLPGRDADEFLSTDLRRRPTPYTCYLRPDTLPPGQRPPTARILCFTACVLYSNSEAGEIDEWTRGSGLETFAAGIAWRSCQGTGLSCRVVICAAIPNPNYKEDGDILRYATGRFVDAAHEPAQVRLLGQVKGIEQTCRMCVEIKPLGM
jgi:hypothetical protein